MSTPAAPQITKEQLSAALDQAFALFQARLKPYELKEPRPVFNLLLQFARQVGAFVGLTQADPAQIAEAVYTQIKPDAHLYDRTSVGSQRQREGRPPQMSDFVIQWMVPPPALTKIFPKHRSSWIDEFDQREKEQEIHAEYIKWREAQEKARAQCPGVIAQFAPTRFGRLDYAAQREVTDALQKYLDGQEAKHQADLRKYEADKTFGIEYKADGTAVITWSVDWPAVLEKMRRFADDAYNRIEGHTPLNERSKGHVIIQAPKRERL